MKAKLKGSEKQKHMHCSLTHMCDAEVDARIASIETNEDRDALLAELLKLVISMRHNIRKNRK